MCAEQVCALLLDTDFDEFVLVTKLEDLPDMVIVHRVMHNYIVYTRRRMHVFISRAALSWIGTRVGSGG